MVKGLLHRAVLASPGVLLVLFATTTTTLLPHRAGASTTTATTAADDDTDSCEAETSACAFDATCSSCNLIAFASNSEYQECFNSGDVVSGDDFLGCTGFMAGPCCIDEVSDLECLESDIFVELKLCTMASLGCSVDEITCSDSDDVDDNGSAVSANNGAPARLGGGASTAAAAVAAVVVSAVCAFGFLLPPSLLLV